MIPDEAKQKLRRLIDARTKRDEAKVALKNAEEEYREIEAEVHEELKKVNEKNGRLSNVDLGDGYGTISFQARSTIFGRIIDENAAVEHFREKRMIDEVSKPKLVGARVNEVVRDAYEQGESMPPGLDYYRKEFVAITKQKGS